MAVDTGVEVVVVMDTEVVDTKVDTEVLHGMAVDTGVEAVVVIDKPDHRQHGENEEYDYIEEKSLL